jgi:HlyD family secretion protein
MAKTPGAYATGLAVDCGAASRGRQRSRSAITSRVTVLLTGLVLTGCSRTESPPGSAAGKAAAATFTVVRPQKKALPKVIEQPGAIQAYESAPLFAKLAGFVKKVYVDIGDPLEGPAPSSGGGEGRPGTVLAELSIPELEDEGRQKDALVEQARAEVEQARQQIVIAETNVASAEAQVVAAKAGQKAAEAALKRWESESARVAQMLKDKVVNQQTADETENQLRAAGAAADEARARVVVAQKATAKAQAEFGKAQEDVKAEDAKRKVAEADAARLRSLLEYRFIRAPFAGIVTRRGVDPGHFVQPAGAVKGEALFTVVRLDTVRVPVDVPEADAGLVKKGDKASVHVPALGAADLAGHVARTAGALEPSSRTLRVEIDLPNADRKLLPQMYAYVRITVEMPAAWVLPANAVVKQADQTVCFLYRDGKAVRLPVRSGRTDGTWTEVFAKQKAGAPGTWEDWTGTEEVLSGLANTLTDGQPVSVGR